MTSDNGYECLIIGGGPGGLSAALTLGRCRHKVLVLDSGRYRNAASSAMHGYLTRDGISPSDFLREAHREIRAYPTVTILFETVQDVGKTSDGFELTLSNGQVFRSSMLVLATGLSDDLPKIQGAEQFFGRGVYHCPFCDGWEQRDKAIAVYGNGDASGAEFALTLLQWSKDLVLCTDGEATISEGRRRTLEAFHIPVRESKIMRIEGREGVLEKIVFEEGPDLERQALFFNTSSRQGNDFAKRLGCDGWAEEGCDLPNPDGSTNCEGLYIVGDASRDVMQVIVAAAEGAQAAISIHKKLVQRTFFQG